MPCRDWSDRDYGYSAEHRKELDALAVRECNLSALLVDLVKSGNHKLTGEQKRLYTETVKRHKKHRECDKKSAISEVDSSIRQLEQSIQQIRQLGGTPKKELRVKLEKLQKQKANIEDSDSLETDLY